jgi:hypothetical protein
MKKLNLHNIIIFFDDFSLIKNFGQDWLSDILNYKNDGNLEYISDDEGNKIPELGNDGLQEVICTFILKSNGNILLGIVAGQIPLNNSKVRGMKNIPNQRSPLVISGSELASGITQAANSKSFITSGFSTVVLIGYLDQGNYFIRLFSNEICTGFYNIFEED